MRITSACAVDGVADTLPQFDCADWPIYTDVNALAHFWSVASADEIVAGWTVKKLENITKLTGKTITCTEVGYQSRNYAWIRGLNDLELDPVDCSSTPNCVNLLAQARAYEGLCVCLLLWCMR